MIYNHITLRVPGPEPHFLINPYGLNYSEVTARNLVKIDLDGNVLDGSKFPVNLAGFVIHGAIHKAREDVSCVLHTHTRAGMAVSCMEEGVLTSTADANVGSIFGIGFAAWTGGALQFINQYGVKDFVARAQYLAEQYGERFAPPALLLEKAAKGEAF